MKNKNEKEETEERKLSLYEKFIIPYRKLPWFNALSKLSFYLLFFIIMIVLLVVLSFFDGIKKGNNTQETTVVKYQDILNKLLDNSRYTATININGNKYIATCEYGNNILTGVYETSTGTYKFKIQNNNIYELRMDEEIANDTLLNDINYRLLLNDYLINLIKSNSGIKVDGEHTTYKYDTVKIDGNMYKMEIIIINNKVSNIKIYDDITTYDIKYE